MTGLCHLAKDWGGLIPTDGLMAEEKINGFRSMAYHGIDGQRYLFSREGMPIHGTGHIIERAARLEDVAGMRLFIDGEFQVNGSLEATKAWFESGYKHGGEAGTFFVFDVMPFDEWQRGGCEAPLYRRKEWLRQLVEASEPVDDGWTWREGSRGQVGPTPLTLIEDQWVSDVRDVLDMARGIWARGGEGVMLKNPMSPYRRSRTDAWQKVKIENEHKWRLAA